MKEFSIYEKISSKNIYVEKISGQSPGIFYCHGLHSDTKGRKISAIREEAKKRKIEFTSFEYSGHGNSSGSYEDARISDWFNEAIVIFDKYTNGKQILVGSSLGSWITFHLALKNLKKIAGIVALAPAVNFTKYFMRNFIKKNEEMFSAIIKENKLTKEIIEDGNKNCLINYKKLLIDLDSIPIRLVHGTDDFVVPFMESFYLADAINSANLLLNIIPHEDHNFRKKKSSLQIILDTIFSLF